jgi:hypothetical protein
VFTLEEIYDSEYAGDTDTQVSVYGYTCNYESVSTDTVDSNKGSADPRMNGTWQVVKSSKSHC